MPPDFWMPEEKRKKQAQKLTFALDGKDDKGNALNQPHRTASLLETAKLPDEDRRSVLKEAQKSEADLTHALNDLVHIAEGKNPPPRKTADLFYGPEGVNLPDLTKQGVSALEKLKDKQIAERTTRKEQSTGRIDLNRDAARARNQGGQWPDLNNMTPAAPTTKTQQDAKNPLGDFLKSAASGNRQILESNAKKAEIAADFVEKGLSEADPLHATYRVVKPIIKYTSPEINAGIEDGYTLEEFEFSVMQDIMFGTTDDKHRQDMLQAYIGINDRARDPLTKGTQTFIRKADDFVDRTALSAALATPRAISGAILGSEFGPVGAGFGAVMASGPTAMKTWKASKATQQFIGTATDTYLALESERLKSDKLNNVPPVVTRRIIPLAAAAGDKAIELIGEKQNWPKPVTSKLRGNIMDVLQSPDFSATFAQEGEIQNSENWNSQFERAKRAVYIAIRETISTEMTDEISQEDISTFLDQAISPLKQ